MKRNIAHILLAAIMLLALNGGAAAPESSAAAQTALDPMIALLSLPAPAEETSPLAPISAAPANFPLEKSPKELLPVPVGLEGKVRFWEMVYSDYGRADLIIYHREYPEAVYAVHKSLPGRGDRTIAMIRKRLLEIDRIMKNSSDPLLAIVRRPDADQLLETYHQLDGVPGDDRFAVAAQDGMIATIHGHRDDLIRAFERAAPYLPAMEREFEARGVPTLLTRLVFVESMFMPNARSNQGAYGVFQLLPGTARHYLSVNSIVDQRRDPLASSQAAARLLRSSYKDLGSWPLAVTAYNAGPNRMARVVKETGTSSLPMALAKTEVDAVGYCVKNFYARLIGIVRAEIKLDLSPPAAEGPPALPGTVEIALPHPFILPELAQRLGLTAEQLVSYNPGWSTAVVTATRPLPAGYKLRVPPGLEEYATVVLEVPPQDPRSLTTPDPALPGPSPETAPAAPRPRSFAMVDQVLTEIPEEEEAAPPSYGRRSARTGGDDGQDQPASPPRPRRRAYPTRPQHRPSPPSQDQGPQKQMMQPIVIR